MTLKSILAAATFVAVTTAPSAWAATDYAGKYPGYQLAYDENFDDPATLDRNFNFENGYCRNNENQYYRRENASVSNGNLVIKAERCSQFWDGGKKMDFYSSSVKSNARYHYGVWETRAKIPVGSGLWPAIWGTGNTRDWPAAGEIDILEYYNFGLHANVAWGDTWQSPVWDAGYFGMDQFASNFADEYHTWRMEWDHNTIRLYVDDRLLNAPFDERLSLVSLLLSGLNNRFTASRRADAAADACYAFLREAKQGFATLPDDIPDGPATLFNQMMTDYDAETRRQREAGLLSRDALATRLKVYAVLRQWEAELRRAKAVGTQEAFDLLRTQFQSLSDERDAAQEAAASALEAAFDFMEQAFAESQEMVVFVTELTLAPAAHAFITENGCPRYFQYNKDLLLDHRKAALQQELAAEERRHGGM